MLSFFPLSNNIKEKGILNRNITLVKYGVSSILHLNYIQNEDPSCCCSCCFCYSCNFSSPKLLLQWSNAEREKRARRKGLENNSLLKKANYIAALHPTSLASYPSLGSVVQKLVNTNLRLKGNQGFFSLLTYVSASNFKLQFPREHSHLQKSTSLSFKMELKLMLRLG